MAFKLLSSCLRATWPLRDLKECDGTHSERCVRRLPSLRNKHEHRTKKAYLWASCVLSVAFLVSLFSFPFSEDHRPLAEGIKTAQEEREKKTSADISTRTLEYQLLTVNC